MTTDRKGKQGFASMSPERRREIARLGGRAAVAKGVGHRFTPEEAAEAGRKGGKISAARGTGHRYTSAEAKIAGSKGGKARSLTKEGKS